jgi:hypothetical protein
MPEVIVEFFGARDFSLPLQGEVATNRLEPGGRRRAM